MKAKDFDKKFDDPPMWMIASLDKEAARIGVTRQSILCALTSADGEALFGERFANGRVRSWWRALALLPSDCR